MELSNLAETCEILKPLLDYQHERGGMSAPAIILAGKDQLLRGARRQFLDLEIEVHACARRCLGCRGDFYFQILECGAVGRAHRDITVETASAINIDSKLAALA